MAPNRHASPIINHNMFIYIAISLLLPMANEGAPGMGKERFQNDDGKRLTREYHLKQGALRGWVVKPSRHYDLQPVEMFLGVPYAAAPTGSYRFMPPKSAPPWPGVKMATHFAPVCPQSLPPIKKGDPPTWERQNYLTKLKTFLKNESEDCLYLNIYVPYRDQKSKKFPVLVFIHGDSFEWSSGNPYDGKILASYGNIMVITVNFRLGILGFMKPSLTEHEYGNNGLLDQLAALQWIKDNIEDLNGDPNSVTLMGHGTGAACVSFLMLSPISNGLFHRAILMSGSALADWAITKDPMLYTTQVAQTLGCSLSSREMMKCLQNQSLSDIQKVQILARDFETPLGPTVAGSFIPSEPAKTMESFPNLLSKYQLLSGVTEFETYHDFGVLALGQGVLETQRDEMIIKYGKVIFEGAENQALKEILKQYAPSKLDPKRWSVEANRDVVLDLFSDARTITPTINFANYQSKANRQSYFYVFGHNSVSTDYAQLNKSVHGQEMPYVLGVPLGGANTHFTNVYTQSEKLLSEVIMRLWTNFVKIGTPNTQSVNKYFTADKNQWNQYNVEWPEYDDDHQSYLKLDIPPHISSLYRANYTNFWTEALPSKMRRFVVDPMFEYTSVSTARPKPTHRSANTNKKVWSPQVDQPRYSPPAPRFSAPEPPRYTAPAAPRAPYGTLQSYSAPVYRPDSDDIYRQIQSIITPKRPPPPNLMEKISIHPTTEKPKTNNMPVKISSATITLVISLSVLFLLVNFGICSILYFKRRKLRSMSNPIEVRHQSRADMGEVDVIGQKSSKDDKSALQSLKNSCSVIKSMSFSKIKNNTKKTKKKPEPCKTPKSDDSGGFRERFQLRRHLSTSTLDAHTKVRDWIANEVMHRCSPSILRKSNSELNNDKQMSLPKPFTRSEELLSDSRKPKKDTLKVNDGKHLVAKATGGKTHTSEKTTSTSALGSHSSLGSNKQSLASTKSRQGNKSSDSIKSKGTESVKSKKVSVAIDATPAARTNSILKQEPIEITKSFDYGENIHSNKDNKLQRSKTDVITTKPEQENPIFTNVVTLSVGQKPPLKISHKHSTSDPVTEVNYDKLMKEKYEGSAPIIDILPPVTFRNDINVTSRDECVQTPMTPEEALLTIKKRNFPKVLPDLPKAQKRLSLQPTTMQTFRNFNVSTESDRLKVPPQPPPRTTTLDRRLAYKNSKPLSSFDSSNYKKIAESDQAPKNYENINTLSPYVNQSFNRSFENKQTETNELAKTTSNERDYPKVIIASSIVAEPKIIIKPSPSQTEIPTNIPRVRLPDDFHSQTTGSITSFSSFYSDDDDEDEIDDEIFEDKLLQELVGGVESPTENMLDSKGPATAFERTLEIVPVKINPGHIAPKNKEDYICISDLRLPDVSDLEKTAQIKPTFGLNKLQHRTESIHRPPEKAVKVKQKRTNSILNRTGKGKRRSNKSDGSNKTSLEHSNSGSSNDTETSTGTVRKVEVKKDS